MKNFDGNDRGKLYKYTEDRQSNVNTWEIYYFSTICFNKRLIHHWSILTHSWNNYSLQNINSKKIKYYNFGLNNINLYIYIYIHFNYTKSRKRFELQINFYHTYPSIPWLYFIVVIRSSLKLYTPLIIFSSQQYEYNT